MPISENQYVFQFGLALTEEERKSLEAEGFEFTGWYNQHGQPILRYTQTGEEISLCRVNYSVAITCGGCI